MITRYKNSFKLNKRADGKLCSTCCAPIQFGQQCGACPHDAIIPEKLIVEFTGTTVNSTPSWSYIWFYNNWVNRWQWFSLDTIDGVYEVPLVFKKYYLSPTQWVCGCAGQVEVPLEGTFFECWSTSGSPCGPVVVGQGPYYHCEHGWSFDKLVIGVEVEALPIQNPTTLRTTVVADIPGPGGLTSIRLFNGPIYRPLSERTCFYEEGIPNGLDTPYSCDPEGPHYPLEGDVPLAWGGTVKIVPDGVFKDPVWLKSLSGPNVTQQYGNRWVFAYAEFDDPECTNPGLFKVQYKVTCNAGAFVGESAPYSAEFMSLAVLVPNDGSLGFTTFEITGIVPLDPHAFWDSTRNVVPSIVSGVFA